MKGIFIYIILFNLIAINLLMAQKDMKLIDNDSIIILNSNVTIFKEAQKESISMVKAQYLDILKIKGKDIVDGRMKVIDPKGLIGWIEVKNTSYIGNLFWRKFDRINWIELYLPEEKNISFTNEVHTNQDGTLDFINYFISYLNFNITIGYENGKDVFDIDHLSKTDEMPRDSYIDLKYFGYEAYYHRGYEIEGNLYYILYIVKPGRKIIYAIVVTFKREPTEEEELTAKKILFSVRIKDTSNSSEQPSSDQLTQTYTITGDNINVRAEAATNGAVLVKLSKGAKVTLLERSDKELVVGDKKGFWAYVDTGITNKDGETIKGWVFDYYLKEEK